jgi:tetratricopeptide (TPR) repeat protein
MKLPFTKQRPSYLTKILFAFALLGAGMAIGFFTHRLIQQPIKQRTVPVSAHLISGQEALKSRNLPIAFKHYLTALATTPDIKPLLNGLAQISSLAKQYNLATSFLTVARTIDNNNPAITLALAQAYAHDKHNDKALELLLSLSRIKQPLSEELTLQASRLFAEIGALEKALTYAEKAATINPRNPIALANVGNMHNRLGNLDTAVTYYKKALAIKDDIPNLIYNLGYTIKRLGKLQEALPYFDRAIALKPDYLDAIIDRAYTYWALGDFERAWQDYAWRFNMHGANPTSTLPMPLWDGRDLKGKTILLYAEQGLGDTLQFIRLAESVKKRGNPKIICKVQKPLVKLLQSYPYVDTFVTAYETKNIDYQAPLMSLPGILKLTPANIPAPKTYLSADKKLVTEWQKKLSERCACSDEQRSSEFRVGLCWHVDPIHEKDKSPVSRRSVAIKDLLPLGTLPNVSFYALQQGQGLEEINSLPESFKLTAFDPYFDKRHGSFMDSAAVIANMDLVITVDTAIAHLAGALGKEVWIFLPFSPDGRWSHTTNKTPWYPTARLFRQTKPSDWKTPINDIKKLLQQRVVEKKKILNSNKA